MIVDTGVLYAAMAPRDRNHAACAKLLRTTRELLLPAPVLVELDYFLSQLTGSHRPFNEVPRRVENGAIIVLDLGVPARGCAVHRCRGGGLGRCLSGSAALWPAAPPGFTT